MRRYCLLFALGLAGAASASFDLMLLGDNTTAGSQRVVRYDPVNRVVLGSFGTGMINSNIQDIAVDMNTNKAFVLDSVGYMRVFNYYSGELLQMGFVGSSYNQMSYDTVLDRLMLSAYNGVLNLNAKAYSSSLTLLQNYAPNYGVYGTVARRTDGNYYAYWDLNPGTSSTLVPRIFNVSTGVTSGSASSFVGVGQVRGTAIGADSRFYGLQLASGNLALVGCNTNTTGITSTGTTFVNFGATSFDNQDLATGHGNIMYVLDGATITTCYSGSTIAGEQTVTFATGANIRGMALVIAPEPGQYLAFGVGIAGLLIRRKKRTR